MNRPIEVLRDLQILPEFGVKVIEANLVLWNINPFAELALCNIFNWLRSPHLTIDDVLRAWKAHGLHEWIDYDGSSDHEWWSARANDVYLYLLELHEERDLI